jgi:hypothetical protein
LGSELGAVGMTPAGKETARTQGPPGLERWRRKEDDWANSPKQDGQPRNVSSRSEGQLVDALEEARPQNWVHLHAGLQDRRRHRVHVTGGLLPVPGVFGVLAVPFPPIVLRT